MRGLLEAELIKLRTTRTFLALAGAAVATSLLITCLVALLSEPTESSVLTDVFQSDTSGFFITILAIVGITGEWRHRTITSSLLAAPARVRFLLAKTLAFAVAGLLLSLLISVAITIAGYAILSSRDLPTPEFSDALRQIGLNAIVAALVASFGVGLGALIRNQPVAIVGLLLIAFVVEPTLIALAPDVGVFGPTGALPTSIADIDPDAAGYGDVDLLSPGLALLAMLAWIGAAFALAATLLKTRDLT